MIMPVVAGVVYAGMWNLGLDDTAVEELFSMMPIVQMLAGVIAFGWAARRALRRDRNEVVPSSTLQ